MYTFLVMKWSCPTGAPIQEYPKTHSKSGFGQKHGPFRHDYALKLPVRRCLGTQDLLQNHPQKGLDLKAFDGFCFSDVVFYSEIVQKTTVREQGRKKTTPPKTNMEPENRPSEKAKHLQGPLYHFKI